MTIREEIKSAIEANKEALKKVRAKEIEKIKIYLPIDKKPKLYSYENNNHHFDLNYTDRTKHYNENGSKKFSIFEALGLDGQTTCQTHYKLDKDYLTEPWPYSHTDQIRPHVARNLWEFLFVKANQKLNTLLQSLTEDSPSSEHSIVKLRSVLPPAKILGGTAGVLKNAMIDNIATIDKLLGRTVKPEAVSVQLYCTRREELVLMTYRHSGDEDHYSGGSHGNDGIFRSLGIDAHGTSGRFYEIQSASSTFPSFKRTQSYLNEKIINFWIEILTLANEGLKEQLKDHYRGESDTTTSSAGLDLKQSLIKRAKDAIAQNETELRQLETDYLRKFKIFLIRKDINQKGEIKTFDYMWKKDHFSNQKSSLQNDDLLIALGFDTHENRNIYCGKFYKVDRGGAWPSRSSGLHITKVETINVWTDIYKLANKTIADYIRTLDGTYTGYTTTDSWTPPIVEESTLKHDLMSDAIEAEKASKVAELNSAIESNLKAIAGLSYNIATVSIKLFDGHIVNCQYKYNNDHYDGLGCGNSLVFSILGMKTSDERHDYVAQFYTTARDGVWPAKRGNNITAAEGSALWKSLFELANKALRHQIYKLGGVAIEHLHKTSAPVVPQEHSPFVPREPAKPDNTDLIRHLKLALEKNTPKTITDRAIVNREAISIRILNKDGLIETLDYQSSVKFFSNTPSGDNDKIFRKLGISAETTCKKFYTVDGGNWPQKRGGAITGKEATALWTHLYGIANDAIVRKIVELGGSTAKIELVSNFGEVGTWPSEMKQAKITSVNPCSEVELPDPFSWMDEIGGDLTWDAAPTPTIATPEKIVLGEAETVKIDLGIKPSLNTSGIVLEEEEEITYKF